MAKDYATVGSPFDFLGHMTETQKGEFYKWLDKRKGNFSDIEKWWRIRSHQLRKTAGFLESWYKAMNDEPLEPRWDKKVWEADPDGHLLYTNRDDQLPSVCVSRIKDLFKEQLQRDDEGMFQMNHIRTLIEKAEDKAQFAHEAPSTNTQLRADLDRYFSQPEYQAVLVRNESDLYNGEPRYRTHQLNAPTTWERDNYTSKS